MPITKEQGLNKNLGKSLQNKAMLVEITLSSFGTVKKDYEETEKLRVAHGATAINAVSVSKNILPDNPALKRITKIKGVARNWSKKITLPWYDRGPRILAATNFQEHKDRMTELEADFDDAVAEFVKDYKQERERAKARMGTLFNDTDYPHEDSISSFFSFDVVYSNIPDASDFRVDLATEDIQKVQKAMRQHERDVIKKSKERVLKEFQAKVSHLKKTLEKAGEGKNWHATLTSNIGDLARWTEGFNMDDDGVVKEIASEAAKLGNVNALKMKKDDDQIDSVKADSEKLLDTINKHMEGIKL